MKTFCGMQRRKRVALLQWSISATTKVKTTPATKVKATTKFIATTKVKATPVTKVKTTSKAKATTIVKAMTKVIVTTKAKARQKSK